VLSLVDTPSDTPSREKRKRKAAEEAVVKSQQQQQQHPIITIKEIVEPPPAKKQKERSSRSKASSASSSTAGHHAPAVGGTITTQTVGHYVDEDGNQVWICPACGKQDDGSPMIGCDGCDDWYHWLCVGINLEPEPNQQWYCQRCVAKRRL
jgi:transcription initiation factor TFIID subunit 3